MTKQGLWHFWLSLLFILLLSSKESFCEVFLTCVENSPNAGTAIVKAAAALPEEEWLVLMPKQWDKYSLMQWGSRIEKYNQKSVSHEPTQTMPIYSSAILSQRRFISDIHC